MSVSTRKLMDCFDVGTFPEPGGQVGGSRIRAWGDDLAPFLHRPHFFKGRRLDIAHVPSPLLAMPIQVSPDHRAAGT